MSSTGTAICADNNVKHRESSVASENAIPDSRSAIILNALLDSLSFALFYLPFSSLTHLVNAAWLSLIAQI
jgi:hypothetical protein